MKSPVLLFLTSGNISRCLWGGLVVPSFKKIINLPRTYEKLPAKGEPDRFNNQRDSWVQTYKHTDKQTDILLRYYKDKLLDIF